MIFQSLVKRNPSLSKEINSTSMHAFANGQDIDDCDDSDSLRRETRLSSSSQTNTSSSGMSSEILLGSSGEDDASTPTKAIQALAKQIEVSMGFATLLNGLLSN